MKIQQSYIILFLIFSALLTTIWDYQFGQMDHVEHLPLLFRAENPDYLSNDGFLNSYAKNYDPRYYYTLLLLLGKRIISLPLLFLLLTFSVNFLIAYASFKTASKLTDNKLAGIIAVFFSMSLPTAEWGSVSHIHADYLTPNWMAFALVLWSVPDILEKKWIKSALKLGFASLIHPLAGPESAVIFFSSAFIITTWEHGLKLKRYSNFVIGGTVLMLMIIISLIPYFTHKGEPLDDNLFIELYANFRVPHHILPSYFLTPTEKSKGLYILILIFIGWIYFFIKFPQKRTAQYFLIHTISALILLAAAGYIFTEIYPLKIAVIAHIYRMLYVLKWIYLILLAMIIGELFKSGKHLDKIYAIFSIICSFSPIHLIYLLLVRLSVQVFRRYTNKETYSLLFEMPALIIIGILSLMKSYESSIQFADFHLWSIMAISVLLGLSNNKGIIKKAFLPIITITVLVYWTGHIRSDKDKSWKKAISRVFSLEDFPSDILSFSKKVKELTPENAVLIVPPMFGELRYLADRAVLVTFKTLPFGGKEMLDWREQLFDCYTWTDKKGFDAVLWAFEPNYKIIGSQKLMELKAKYGTEYAVLYKETETDFPILFENDLYKLIYIAKNPE